MMVLQLWAHTQVLFGLYRLTPEGKRVPYYETPQEALRSAPCSKAVQDARHWFWFQWGNLHDKGVHL